MELTQEQMNSIVKGYEAFPVALGAMTEQLNKMNGYLGSIVSKQKIDDDERVKEETEEKMRKQVEKELKKQLKNPDIKKSPDLIEEEAANIKAKPQSEAQETIEGGGQPSGAGGSFKKANDDEEDKEEEKACNTVEEKKANDNNDKEKDKEFFEEKANDKEDEKEEKQEDKEEDKDKYPELEKLIKNLVRSAVETEIKKFGYVKSGITTKAITVPTGQENVEIVKSKTPIKREDLIKELTGLSWRQLSQLQTDVTAGNLELPQVEG